MLMAVATDFTQKLVLGCRDILITYNSNKAGFAILYAGTSGTINEKRNIRSIDHVNRIKTPSIPYLKQ